LTTNPPSEQRPLLALQDRHPGGRLQRGQDAGERARSRPGAVPARITQIFVCDDASDDSTYLVGLGYKQVVPDLPLTIIRNPRNLGYGGNQKGRLPAGDRGMASTIIGPAARATGQYAPECLEEIVAPLERGECDAVSARG